MFKIGKKMAQLEKRYNVWFVKNLTESMGSTPRPPSFPNPSQSCTSQGSHQWLLIVICQNLYLTLNKYYF